MPRLLGQASSEQLLLLAAALIVALVAIALVAGPGSPASRASESTQYWSSTGPIAITGQQQRGDTLTVTLFNREPNWVVIDMISAGNSSVAPNERMNAGGYSTFSISGLRACSKEYDHYEYAPAITFSSLDLPGQVKRGDKPLSGVCEIA